MEQVPAPRHDPAPPSVSTDRTAVPVFPVIPELADELPAGGAAPRPEVAPEPVAEVADITVERRRGRWAGVLLRRRASDQAGEEIAA